MNPLSIVEVVVGVSALLAAWRLLGFVAFAALAWAETVREMMP